MSYIYLYRIFLPLRVFLRARFSFLVFRRRPPARSLGISPTFICRKMQYCMVNPDPPDNDAMEIVNESVGYTGLRMGRRYRANQNPLPGGVLGLPRQGEIFMVDIAGGEGRPRVVTIRTVPARDGNGHGIEINDRTYPPNSFEVLPVPMGGRRRRTRHKRSRRRSRRHH